MTDTDTLTIELLAERVERFTGTAEEIVAAMNASAFSPCETSRAYMARWNRFSDLTEGQTYRTESAAAFVEDLVAFGRARRLDAGNPSD